MYNYEHENFTYNGESIGCNLIDFWKFRYPNIFDMQDELSEFIVARALGTNEASNIDYWTLWDIDYAGYRIEIKETSYYHSFNKEGEISKSRNFGITKSNSRYLVNAEGKTTDDYINVFERHNDLYVFCLNTGYSKEESFPLNLNNWEFYVLQTYFINQKCKNNKTISLNRVRKFTDAVNYGNLKNKIDSVIKEIEAKTVSDFEQYNSALTDYPQNYFASRSSEELEITAKARELLIKEQEKLKKE